MTQNLGEAKFLEGVRTAVALALHVTTRNKVTFAPVVPGIEGNTGSQTDCIGATDPERKRNILNIVLMVD